MYSELSCIDSLLFLKIDRSRKHDFDKILETRFIETVTIGEWVKNQMFCSRRFHFEVRVGHGYSWFVYSIHPIYIYIRSQFYCVHALGVILKVHLLMLLLCIYCARAHVCTRYRCRCIPVGEFVEPFATRFDARHPNASYRRTWYFM